MLQDCCRSILHKNSKRKFKEIYTIQKARLLCVLYLQQLFYRYSLTCLVGSITVGCHERVKLVLFDVRAHGDGCLPSDPSSAATPMRGGRHQAIPRATERIVPINFETTNKGDEEDENNGYERGKGHGEDEKRSQV